MSSHTSHHMPHHTTCHIACHITCHTAPPHDTSQPHHTSHHMSHHRSHHTARHVTCRITRHTTCHITCHITSRVTSHVTPHATSRRMQSSPLGGDDSLSSAPIIPPGGGRLRRIGPNHPPWEGTTPLKGRNRPPWEGLIRPRQHRCTPRAPRSSPRAAPARYGPSGVVQCCCGIGFGQVPKPNPAKTNATAPFDQARWSIPSATRSRQRSPDPVPDHPGPLQSSSCTLWSIGPRPMVLWHWFWAGFQPEPFQNQCHSTIEPCPMEPQVGHPEITQRYTDTPTSVPDPAQPPARPPKHLRVCAQLPL